MENASKALIMAASVLLGIMLITFGVALFNIFGSFAKEEQDKISEKNISQFNVQFLKYEGEENTAHEIVSVINLVKNVNNSENVDHVSTQGYGKIQVVVTGNPKISEKASSKELNDFLEKSYDSAGNPISYYKCLVSEGTNGRIQRITFNPIR